MGRHDSDTLDFNPIPLKEESSWVNEYDQGCRWRVIMLSICVRSARTEKVEEQESKIAPLTRPTVYCSDEIDNAQ